MDRLAIDGWRAGAFLQAAARGLLLIVLSIGVSLVLFLLLVLSLVVIVLGIGLFTTPVIVDAIRGHAAQRRKLAREWCGVTIHATYRPLRRQPRLGMAGQVDRTVHLLKEPATWRDAGWLLTDATAGCVLAALVALSCNPLLLRLHILLTSTLIGTSQKELLAQRVARLTETRHHAVDNSAADLRRIERDLHDGAQARLVAMGMSLGAIGPLIEKDPAEARRLLAEARENSQAALAELRDLVRGIHPPVLAERGLADAARALALRMPLPVEVDAELPARLEEAVESASYFAVSEVLANAAKHSGAQRVWLDLYYSHEQQTLRIAVMDDGRGEARLDGGTGLRGIERRLGPFDGILALSSPRGGPTLVTIEIPCALVGQVRGSRAG